MYLAYNAAGTVSLACFLVSYIITVMNILHMLHLATDTVCVVWPQVFQEHESSVNSICWAPQEFGLCLACGSSDGTISVLTHKADGSWEKAKIEQAHPVGVTSVSWAPVSALGSLVGADTGPVQKLVSGGCDNTVKVWKHINNSWKMDCFPPLSKHVDWVRDVAWAPNLGLVKSTIASASQDGTGVIWTQVLRLHYPGHMLISGGSN
jgi:protein transport protein SEC13